MPSNGICFAESRGERGGFAAYNVLGDGRTASIMMQEPLQRGVTPFRTEPVCGPKWLAQFPTTPGRLSNGLATDRQWYALHFAAYLIKGFCNFDRVSGALKPEGVRPLEAYCDELGPYALATLWLNQIFDSVCGRYHEVVLSFDVTAPDNSPEVLRTTRQLAAWAVLYPQFESVPRASQFLHSLWIDSPLSIAWGREMQGFPKHPKPVQTEMVDQRGGFEFNLRWGNDLIFRGNTRKQFGFRGLARETWGLIRTQPWGGILNFLTRSSFSVPIRMPAQTAAQSNVGREYRGHIWKGRHPMAVQVWPWGRTDQLEFGSAQFETGCEPHNGQLLLSGDFQPLSVTYLPRAAAFVEDHPASRCFAKE